MVIPTINSIKSGSGGGGTEHGIPDGGSTGQLLAKKTNVDYDVEWVSGSAITGNDYRTTEQEIGTWIDGRTLYRKVVTGSSLPANDATLISNVADLVACGGEQLYVDGSTRIWLHFPYVAPNEIVLRPELYESSNSIKLNSSGSTLSKISNYKWWFEYTKPQQYVPIEYIQTTGTQYIALNYAGRFRAKLDVMYTDLNTEHASIGGFSNHGSSVYQRNYYYFSSTCYLGYGIDEYASFTDSYTNINERVLQEVSTVSGHVFCKINDNYVYNETHTTDTTEMTQICLGHIQGTTTDGGTARFKIYGFKLYTDMTEESLIRDMVPMIDTFNNNTPGLYDKVNDVFYTNAGSGSFVIPT